MREFFFSNVLPLLYWAMAGAFGWYIAHFVGSQILELQKLRAKTREALVFTANVIFPGHKEAPTFAEEQQRQRLMDEYNRACDQLRLLGAKVQALHEAASGPTRLILSLRHYDLERAGRKLISASNSFARDDGSRAISRHGIQKGLKLKTEYTDEQIKEIEAARLRRMEARQ